MNYCVCGFPTRETSGFCRPCQRRMSDLAAAEPELGPWAAPGAPGECMVQTHFDEGWWCKACRRHHRPARVRPSRRRSPKTNPEDRRDIHYVNVVTPGPLMIARVPWPTPPWRTLLKALTPILREHGVSQRDVRLEGLVPDPSQPWSEEDRATAEALDATFRGAAERFRSFWLYAWRDGRFELVRQPAAAGNPRDPLETLRRRAARGGLQDKVRYVDELDRRGRGSEWREWLALGQRLEMLRSRCQAQIDRLVGAEFETKFMEGVVHSSGWDEWVDLHFLAPVRVRIIGVEAHSDVGAGRVECNAALEPVDRAELMREVSAHSADALPGCVEFGAYVALVDPSGRWWDGGLSEPGAPWLAKGLEPPEWA